MSNTINWSGYEWITQQPWGSVHPSHPDWWYDPDAVDVRGTELVLKTIRSPKIHKEKDIVSRVGAGLVTCTKRFGYGRFEIEAKLPKGPYLWPAFWMYSATTWPPEIDVFEGYTNRFGSYIDFTGSTLLGKWWNVKTNAHYDVTPHNKNVGAKKYWMGLTSPAKKYNRYAVDWNHNHISFYFNDNYVGGYTDPELLDWFRDAEMWVVINNGIRDGYPLNSHITSEMSIKSFNYTQYTPVTLLNGGQSVISP